MTDTIQIHELLTNVADPDAAHSWAEPFGDDLHAAWESCPRAAWLLRLASAAKVDGRAYARASLAVADRALRLAPEARRLVSPHLMTLEAWIENRRTDADAKDAVERANVEASRVAPLQGARESTENHESLRVSLAVRSIARAAEGPNVWPTAADLARAVAAKTSGIQLDEFDQGCAEIVRSMISRSELPRSLARPPAPPKPDPCYVEVRFGSDREWRALKQIWDFAATAKNSGNLDADAGGWSSLAEGQQLEDLRDVAYVMAAGEYEMLEAEQRDGSTGRLPFEPWAFPYGGVTSMCRLARLFGCTVIAHDDGTGRKEGGPSW